MNLKTAQINQSGFTLMEILVATTLFATVLTLCLSLFTQTLKINRRVDALRQVSDATRNFSEYLVREIRNGRIDYSTIDATKCPVPYARSTNKSLGLITREGDRECFYLVSSGTTADLWVYKRTVAGTFVSEKINPENVKLDPAMFRFFVRPLTDPYATPYPGMQPLVGITMRIYSSPNAQDPPQVILYQTTVSIDAYDIPHS